jgi:hypothetical protein
MGSWTPGPDHYIQLEIRDEVVATMRLVRFFRGLARDRRQDALLGCASERTAAIKV